MLIFLVKSEINFVNFPQKNKGANADGGVLFGV